MTSLGHAPGIFTTCPIARPPPFPESKQVDPTSSDSVSSIAAPATADHLDEATSSLNTLDQHRGRIHSRFPEVHPQQDRRCRRGRGMDTAFLNKAGFAAAVATGQAGGRQKVSANHCSTYQERGSQLGFLPLERGGKGMFVAGDLRKERHPW